MGPATCCDLTGGLVQGRRTQPNRVAMQIDRMSSCIALFRRAVTSFESVEVVVWFGAGLIAEKRGERERERENKKKKK